MITYSDVFFVKNSFSCSADKLTIKNKSIKCIKSLFQMHPPLTVCTSSASLSCSCCCSFSLRRKASCFWRMRCSSSSSSVSDESDPFTLRSSSSLSSDPYSPSPPAATKPPSYIGQLEHGTQSHANIPSFSPTRLHNTLLMPTLINEACFFL